MENPFIVVGKIKPEYFCDRQEESQRLIRQMTNGANTVIISPRRLGKTGLIGYCFNNTEVQENYITIFIDILRTSSLNELIYILGKKVFETIGTRSQRLMKLMVTTLKTLNGSFGYDPINNTPTFDIKLGDITNPTYTLEEIFACIEQADKRCIIAIDEFQQIVNYSEKNIEAILRTHIQHCSNANFIFAGSERHIMNEIFLDTARPFYNSAEMMMLKPIAESKYKEFVQYHFKANGKKVEEEAIDLAYQCFEGNTYYLQKTFRTAFSETERGQCVDKKQVADIIDQMISDSNHRYGEVLSRLTLPQKELLYAVASEGRSRQITSGAFIRRHHLQSASSVQAAAKKLLSYGLLSSENSEYYIDDQLMKLWLQQS